MSLVIKPPPPTVPVVDAKGNITLPWDMFLRAIVERIGGVDSPTLPEVNQRIPPIVVMSPSSDDSESLMMIPGPKGDPGENGVSFILLSEQAEDNYYLIPMG